MDEKDTIFREKSMAQLSTPDQLTGYLRVTGPGVWVVLAGIILLLIGLFAWAIFGTIIASVEAPAIVKDGKVSCYLLAEDMVDVDPEIDIQIGDVELEAQQSDAQKITLNSSDDKRLYDSGYLSPGKKAVILTCDTDLTDGFYKAKVITNAMKPISLLFSKGS